ncbi:neuronal acetylcholine receptor subunit alpha-9-like isoform X1 [Rhopilema esculentum]|uniref:neuronal acetylcholine receptor subunit alpha-9-like isoform X1 n=2 Tax=Rhopilema esculentum TaxID=499914 RepID=UPI0031D0AEDF
MEAKMILRIMSFIILCCCATASGSDGEYQLQRLLLKSHDPTVIPRKDTSKALEVKMDVALRSIQSLDGKNEKLLISVWMRLNWKNDFLTWDPRNYSGVDMLHFESRKIWTPDVVLYNSAENSDTGPIFDKMKTAVVVKYDGTSQWFCPMLLKSECSVDLFKFPFDNQTCPLIFGLWAVPMSDIPRVNLTLVSQSGDLNHYGANGVFELNGMPGRQNIIYFPCCPGVPFTRVQYDIKVTRKTVFYLIDFFFPSLILIVLLFMSFTLPPECGERMTLSISLLLAFVLHLLHVSDHIPQTSDAVPMITKLLNVSVALSALTLVSSAVAIKWSCYENNGKSVPWFIRVVLNRFVAVVVCAKKSCSSNSSGNTVKSVQTVNEVGNTDHPSILKPELKESNLRNQLRVNSEEADIASITLRDKTEDEAAPAQQSGISSNGTSNYSYELLRSVCDVLRIFTRKLDEQKSEISYLNEWRSAIVVLDRALFLFALISMFFIVIYLLFFVSKFYIK